MQLAEDGGVSSSIKARNVCCTCESAEGFAEPKMSRPPSLAAISSDRPRLRRNADLSATTSYAIGRQRGSDIAQRVRELTVLLGRNRPAALSDLFSGEGRGRQKENEGESQQKVANWHATKRSRCSWVPTSQYLDNVLFRAWPNSLKRTCVRIRLLIQLRGTTPGTWVMRLHWNSKPEESPCMSD